MHLCAKISTIKVDYHNKFGRGQINKQLLHNDAPNIFGKLLDEDFVAFLKFGWGMTINRLSGQTKPGRLRKWKLMRICFKLAYMLSHKQPNLCNHHHLLPLLWHTYILIRVMTGVMENQFKVLLFQDSFTLLQCFLNTFWQTFCHLKRAWIHIDLFPNFKLYTFAEKFISLLKIILVLATRKLEI